MPTGLEAGDVLLFCPKRPSPVQSAIVSAQELVCGERVHSCFTHVAIYMGGEEVRDATPFNGVRARPFKDAAGDGYVRARRLVGITAAMQGEICLAASLLDGQYAALQAMVDTLLGAAPSVYGRALHGLIRAAPIGNSPRQSFYCSSLVEAAYVTGINVSVGGVALPCTYSADSQFEEVKIAW